MLLLGTATNPPTSSVLLTLSTKPPKGGASGSKQRGKAGGKKKPIVIGKANIAIPVGAKRSLKVQLNKKGRKLVGSDPLKATLKIVATGSDGTEATEDKKVKLVPKKGPKSD